MTTYDGDETLPYHKKWKQDHPEQWKLYQEKYRASHKEQRKKSHSEYYFKNKAKINKYQKEWWAKNSNKRRDYWYQKKYGVSYNYYKMIEASQNNKCAVCKQPEVSFKTLCLDHDHKTKKVRGLLCHNCNSALGMIHDSTYILDSMKRYLKEYGYGR